mgnify:CR=1 FL=1
MTYKKLMANWSRRGRPRIANGDVERCQALTVMTSWKIRNKREQRCPFESKYAVGGKELCRHHAVMEAMAIMIERLEVMRISRNMPRQDARVPVVNASTQSKRRKRK